MTVLSRDMGNSEAEGKEVTLPWQEMSPMTERERFVDAHLQGDCSIAELCRRYEHHIGNGCPRDIAGRFTMSACPGERPARSCPSGLPAARPAHLESA